MQVEEDNLSPWLHHGSLLDVFAHVKTVAVAEVGSKCSALLILGFIKSFMLSLFETLSFPPFEEIQVKFLNIFWLLLLGPH